MIELDFVSPEKDIMISSSLYKECDCYLRFLFFVVLFFLLSYSNPNKSNS